LGESIIYGPVVIVNGVLEKPVWAEEVARLYLYSCPRGVGIHHLHQRGVEGDLKLKPIQVGHILDQHVGGASGSQGNLL
jgi:hypothetical protein